MTFLYTLYQQPAWTAAGILLLAVWTLVWKGIALWFAGKNQQKAWFIVMLILNTAGLLPIIYLIWFKPKTVEPVKKKPKRKK